jgi:hypothetical protein
VSWVASVPINLSLLLTFPNHFNPISPTPSNPHGRVLGFQIPALKHLHQDLSIRNAIFNTCSSVSALQGPRSQMGELN